MNATRVRHLENALGLFEQMRKNETPFLPLDLFLRRYFQGHRPPVRLAGSSIQNVHLGDFD